MDLGGICCPCDGGEGKLVDAVGGVVVVEDCWPRCPGGVVCAEDVAKPSC